MRQMFVLFIALSVVGVGIGELWIHRCPSLPAAILTFFGLLVVGGVFDWVRKAR